MPDRDAHHVLAVDIGSTRMHVGLVDTGGRRCLFRADFPLSEMRRRLPRILKKTGKNVPVVVAGGRWGGRARKAEKILRAGGIASIATLSWLPNLPIRFSYKNRTALGADRIADALYAAAVYPKRNVVIIDAGTAITVDAVSGAGKFTGGVILAGVEMQLRSLHATTGVLPLVGTLGTSISFPGTSTEDCLLAGAAHGTAGALNHLVRKYRSLLGGKCTVLATGGGWHLTRKFVDFDFIEVPDMTLIGTGCYVLSMSDSA